MKPKPADNISCVGRLSFVLSCTKKDYNARNNINSCILVIYELTERKTFANI